MANVRILIRVMVGGFLCSAQRRQNGKAENPLARASLHFIFSQDFRLEGYDGLIRL